MMDIYAGNSTLYRYIHRYRQPVFLDRNLRYLFDTRSNSNSANPHLATHHNSSAASDSGTGVNHHHVVNSVRPRARKRRAKRRRVAIDDVSERLLATSIAQSATASVSDRERSSFVVQPILKIEVVGIVKLARSLRCMHNSFCFHCCIAVSIRLTLA